MKHIFTSGGECKRLSLMTLKCTLILEIAFVQESQIFIALIKREKKLQIGPSKYHGKDFEV